VAFISFSLGILALLLAIPAAVFFVEVVAAIALGRQVFATSSDNDVRQRVAVLVPAHNESSGLLSTLTDIKAQMRAGDRLIVVADNCADDTAAVASTAGAEVIERDDPNKRGKGYALAWGLDFLAKAPPDIIIIIDADCRLGDHAIDRLATACAATHRPVQALDLMVAPDESRINFRVAEFAWRVKNWVRPLGLAALGLPCQLMGTGMAFPWDVIRSANLASGSIVEDLKLGLDLALAGHPPLFCTTARVTSDFPLSVEGTQSQRLRWEQGHIGLMMAAPRFISAAIARRDFGLLALAFDLVVPPLSLLAMLAIVISGVAGLATLLGFSSIPMSLGTVSLFAITVGVFLSWLKYGRDILPPESLLLISSYVFGKFPLYVQILSRKYGSRWVRTERSKTGF
jgi:cellulose synthase/poly-beta-1,6-N-acetylglucosamine synthase-like glycosyltransferase